MEPDGAGFIFAGIGRVEIEYSLTADVRINRIEPKEGIFGESSENKAGRPGIRLSGQQGQGLLVVGVVVYRHTPVDGPEQQAQILHGLQCFGGRRPSKLTTDRVGKKRVAYLYFEKSAKGTYGL